MRFVCRAPPTVPGYWGWYFSGLVGGSGFGSSTQFDLMFLVDPHYGCGGMLQQKMKEILQKEDDLQEIVQPLANQFGLVMFKRHPAHELSNSPFTSLQVKIPRRFCVLHVSSQKLGSLEMIWWLPLV